jgi:aryl-alcohol dehydrogenase-like predicted oxidoreductase
MGVFDVLQIPYSALQPEHEAAIAEAARGGAGIVIRGGVARGEPGTGQGSTDVWKFWKHARMDELLEGMSATEFLLRFTITNPDMHTTIVGTLNPAHLHANVAAVLQGPLPAAVYVEAQRRLAAARAVLAQA